MQIYLAARYSRRIELCEYRKTLLLMGHAVQARWLDGNHQLDNSGKPISESGEALVEGNDESTDVTAAILRGKFADDDFQDCTQAEMIISFTEEPRSGHSRGGRHVEFGIGLAKGAVMVAIGHRENIFHWLPQVYFFDTWEGFLEHWILHRTRSWTLKHSREVEGGQ